MEIVFNDRESEAMSKELNHSFHVARLKLEIQLTEWKADVGLTGYLAMKNIMTKLRDRTHDLRVSSQFSFELNHSVVETVETFSIVWLKLDFVPVFISFFLRLFCSIASWSWQSFIVTKLLSLIQWKKMRFWECLGSIRFCQVLKFFTSLMSWMTFWWNKVLAEEKKSNEKYKKINKF